MSENLQPSIETIAIVAGTNDFIPSKQVKWGL